MGARDGYDRRRILEWLTGGRPNPGRPDREQTAACTGHTGECFDLSYAIDSTTSQRDTIAYSVSSGALLVAAVQV